MKRILFAGYAPVHFICFLPVYNILAEDERMEIWLSGGFLHKDPDEFYNLATEPSCQKLVLEYAGKMLSWRLQHDDHAHTDLHLTAQGSMQGMRSR